MHHSSGQFRIIDVASVCVPPWRHRALGDLDSLRESIAAGGLLQPIVVDEGLTLVCGLHRLEACRALGWTEIPAFIQALDGTQAQLAEVDENLCRRELTVLERAEHIALRRKLWDQMHPAPEAPAGKKPPKRQEAPLAMFVDDTARRTGRVTAAVREELRIGELPEDVRATARETPVRDNKRELLALTRMSEEEQRAAMAAVKAGEAKSVRKKAVKQPKEEITEPTLDAQFDALTDKVYAELTPLEPSDRVRKVSQTDERTRAEVTRLVAESQRCLAETLALWPHDPDDEVRWRLEEAARAVERLSRWMHEQEPEREVA